MPFFLVIFTFSCSEVLPSYTRQSISIRICYNLVVFVCLSGFVIFTFYLSGIVTFIFCLSRGAVTPMHFYYYYMYLVLSVYQEVHFNPMPIYYHYLILSVYQRCSYPYAYLLPLPITFSLSGGAVTPMSIYYHYLLHVLSVYQEVWLPLCLSITYYFLSIRRCSYPYAYLLPLLITCTFCLSGGAVTPMPIYYHYLLLSVSQEVRLPLRLALLKVFGALCGLESSIIAHLLYSILPLELVSEILHHNQGQHNI